MADYLEKQISGKTWRRACRVMIENPLGELQTANYIREDVILDGEGKATHKLVDSILYRFDDPGKMVTMIDMDTNEPTKEQYPVGLAAWILYSLYWELSETKDSPKEKPVTPTPEPIVINEPNPVEQPTPDQAKGPIQ